jgi:N-acetylglucosamine malate deacetylase 2
VAGLEQLLGRTLVVVAHPDDETAACGALLQRMRDPLVVFMTDGAPRDPYFWRRHGSREAYAHLRMREACAALGELGVREPCFAPREAGDESLHDQDLAFRLDIAGEVLWRVAEHFRPDAILTLAYEGGHPDHDACSALSHVLGGELVAPVWEAPLYHRNPAGELVFQQFVEQSTSTIAVDCAEAEIQAKRAALKRYESQGDILRYFDPALELVRPQAPYDFGELPHRGALNYEVWGWGIRGQEVSAAFSRYLATSHKVSR